MGGLRSHLEAIRRTVEEIRERLKDQYGLLKEILEATDHENGARWYDLYEDEEC